MRTARTILRMVGAVGLWLWPLLCGLARLFRGFKPGGAQGGLTVVQGWLCVLAPTAAFIYYLCAADLGWTRRLVAVGVLVLVTATDGGFLVAPFLLIGPAAWLVTGRKLHDENQAG